MKSIEESVVIAMDGSDKDLFPFLPYILQDIWEIGADPEAIIKLIRKYCNNIAELKVLDLGCGKGAVSVKVSEKLGCNCYGIDAIHEFIEFAQQKAIEYNVNNLCIFEMGDIREKVKDLSGYDVVILGAIGPVFGDYLSTFSTLSKCINENGIFIIDDGYINDDSDFIHPLMYKKLDILQQLEMAGMQLVENDIMDRDDIKDSDDYIFQNIKRRCNELIEQYPDKQHLFLNYVKNQEIENDILENKVIGTTMVIKKIEKCNVRKQNS
jgi:cyclopropane fatty-acyl-phospholipid synthase-like methyltransferase